MSLILTILLIVITWLLSIAVDAIPHLINWLTVLPLWVVGIVIVGSIAWIVGEP